MIEGKIIPFPKQDLAKAIETQSYNKTVDRYNRFEKIAKLTPTLILASVLGGAMLGWSINNWWQDNKGYLR